MVVGLDRWRTHFADFADRYVLVGGVACDRLMEDAGLAFRATKDLDVVLIVELLDAGFSATFWAFIEAGGYDVRGKAEGGNLYRFTKPKAEDYPYMIELFSRAPDDVELLTAGVLTPLPIAEAAASLSAILLDANYYDYLLANRRELDGLPLLSEVALIPFKAKAHIDLAARKASGEAIDSRDVRKHRSDVFRLLQLLPGGRVQSLPDPLHADLAAFLALVRADPSFKPADLGMRMSANDATVRLAEAYGL